MSYTIWIDGEPVEMKEKPRGLFIEQMRCGRVVDTTNGFPGVMQWTKLRYDRVPGKPDHWTLTSETDWTQQMEEARMRLLAYALAPCDCK